MDRRKELMKRISALALATMMMLSMSDFALAEVLAVTETGVQAEQQEQVSDQNAENTGTVKENADNGSEDDGTVTDSETGQSNSSGNEGPSGNGTDAGSGTGSGTGEPAGEGPSLPELLLCPVSLSVTVPSPSEPLSAFSFTVPVFSAF